jgi:hypothetical protein
MPCRSSLRAPEPLPDWTAGVVSRLWKALKALEAPEPIMGENGRPTLWIR